MSPLSGRSGIHPILLIRGGDDGIVVRVRLADGSVEKLQIDGGTEDTLTLGDILQPFVDGLLPEGTSVRIGTTTTKASKDLEATTLTDLDVRHGSMITILPPSSSVGGTGGAPKFTRKPKSTLVREWDPYPDLAKDYDLVVRQTKTKRSSRSGMSYTDISKIQSSMHVVDPQKEGPIKRLYMCRVSAERFYSNGVVKKKAANKKMNTSFESRCGLLLGTVSRERVDQRPRKARTSLSSQTADSEFCTVAKVQAIWEPPGQSKKQGLPSGKADGKKKSKNGEAEDDGKLYDASIASTMLTRNPRVLTIAKYLGLVPVGWIFSYQDDRLAEENSFGTDGPQALFGLDVAVGGTIKIRAMKNKHNAIIKGEDDDSDDEFNELGDRFVTLAMDATTGATEAFQLSDVSVQMVHEDMFEGLFEGLQAATDSKTKNPPMVSMKHNVVVDGRETKVLDSVLCLINTAVLSHVGSYSGSSSSSGTKKSNGGLTLKRKKALTKALESSEDHDFLEAASDFNVLLALDEMVRSMAPKGSNDNDDDDMRVLCGLVKKWARGQKKGTVIDPIFKMKLKTYLS